MLDVLSPCLLKCLHRLIGTKPFSLSGSCLSCDFLLWFSALILSCDSVSWFSPVILFCDSVLWFSSLILFCYSFLFFTSVISSLFHTAVLFLLWSSHVRPLEFTSSLKWIILWINMGLRQTSPSPPHVCWLLNAYGTCVLRRESFAVFFMSLPGQGCLLQGCSELIKAFGRGIGTQTPHYSHPALTYWERCCRGV